VRTSATNRQGNVRECHIDWRVVTLKICGTQCVKILAKLQQLSGWLNYDNLLNIWHLWIFSLYYLLNLVAMVM